MQEPLPVDIKSLAALVIEWAIIVAAIGLALWSSSPWAYAATFLVVATRQHALLMLFHDAVHGHVARNRRVNDTLINLFVGVPTLLPVETYRPVHLEHHRSLGSASDPERIFLYAGQPWHYRPLGRGQLLRQLAGDLLLVNGIRTLVAWGRAGGLPSAAIETLFVMALWGAGLALLFWYAPGAALAAVALWLVPLLTLTQLLQKLRSFAEHGLGPEATAGSDELTQTWRCGWLGRLTIWPYNINLHREHHASPAVPWHGLPAQARPTRQREGHTLWRVLVER